MTPEETKSWRIVFVYAIMLLIFIGVLVFFSWIVIHVRYNSSHTRSLVHENRSLLQENKERIAEIQVSRITSCKQTYKGIKLVFKPFFPPPPRTKQQQADIDKFNRIIKRLIKGCTIQTKPKDLKSIQPKERVQ